jgi:hypothetical protein
MGGRSEAEVVPQLGDVSGGLDVVTRASAMTPSASTTNVERMTPDDRLAVELLLAEGTRTP